MYQFSLVFLIFELIKIAFYKNYANFSRNFAHYGKPTLKESFFAGFIIFYWIWVFTGIFASEINSIHLYLFSFLFYLRVRLDLTSDEDYVLQDGIISFFVLLIIFFTGS